MSALERFEGHVVAAIAKFGNHVARALSVGQDAVALSMRDEDLRFAVRHSRRSKEPWRIRAEMREEVAIFLTDRDSVTRTIGESGEADLRVIDPTARENVG